MTRGAEKVLQDVLDLSETDRLDVVAEVLARADGPIDPDWEAAWLAELDRREQAESAEPTADQEWPVVRARILTSKR